MEYELIDGGELTIVGTTMRTTNAQAHRTIGAAWHRFIDEGLLQRIHNRVDEHTVLGVYTDFDSDETGEYTFMVGAPVNKVCDVPVGMQARTFVAQRFARISASGEMPGVVAEVWTDVSASPLPRSFTVDYERYDARRLGPHAELEVFVGLTERPQEAASSI